MNLRLITILLLGFGILAISELFPPWIYEEETNSARRRAGYHYFNSPPIKSDAEMEKIFFIPREGEKLRFIVRKDGGLIFLQRVAIGLAVAGLGLLLKRQPSLLSKWAGGVLISLCILFGGLIISYLVMFKS